MYVQERAIRKILIEEFNVDEFLDSEEIENLMALYLKLLEELCNALTILNAWISLQREKENQSARLNLNNQKLSEFVSISLDRIEQLYSKNDLSVLFPEAIEISDEELVLKEAEFRTCNKKAWVYRGKYLVEFLRKFLELLKLDRQSDSPKHFKFKKNVKLTLSKSNILSELSQYAVTPPCLREFLNNAQLSFHENSTNLTMAHSPKAIA